MCSFFEPPKKKLAPQKKNGKGVLLLEAFKLVASLDCAQAKRVCLSLEDPPEHQRKGTLKTAERDVTEGCFVSFVPIARKPLAWKPHSLPWRPTQKRHNQNIFAS